MGSQAPLTDADIDELHRAYRWVPPEPREPQPQRRQFECSLEEVAAELGVTRQAAYAIEKRALRKLRAARPDLADYLRASALP